MYGASVKCHEHSTSTEVAIFVNVTLWISHVNRARYIIKNTSSGQELINHRFQISANRFEDDMRNEFRGDDHHVTSSWDRGGGSPSVRIS